MTWNGDPTVKGSEFSLPGFTIIGELGGAARLAGTRPLNNAIHRTRLEGMKSLTF
jgi:hypothetical protein